MMYPSKIIRLIGIGLLLAIIIFAFFLGQHRLKINSDIISTLPTSDPIVSAAKNILENNPGLDNIYIDIYLEGNSNDTQPLIHAADMVVEKLNAGKLVKIYNPREFAQALTSVFDNVLNHLPAFFSYKDLEALQSTRFTSAAIADRIEWIYQNIANLGQIGRGETLAKDPLGLSELILDKITAMQTQSGATIQHGYLLSKDQRHLLLIAEPTVSERGTEFGMAMNGELEKAAQALKKIETPDGTQLKMVYAGSFRAATDNESIIRKDATRAIFIVTVGLSILILISFRKPWIGLLSVVPAFAGIMLATAVYSLFKSTIFAISMGFGGALISIAVDHGLAYALFIDQPGATSGYRISRQVWSVASFAVYTTLVAMLSLVFSEIPLFIEVGLFSALGVGLAALFVHIFFPLAFPKSKDTSKKPILPIERILSRVSNNKNPIGAIIIGVLALGSVLLFRPSFTADLSSMNTVRPETLAAEKTISDVWGNLYNRIYIMAHSDNANSLFSEIERLNTFLNKQGQLQTSSMGMVPASLFPGPLTQNRNIGAWKNFWNDKRFAQTKKALNDAGEENGFTDDAFEPFIKMIANPSPSTIDIPKSLFGALGIVQDRDKQGWLYMVMVNPNEDYNPESFFKNASEAGFLTFDPAYFSQRLADNLHSSFIKIILIVCLCAVLLLGLLYADWRLLLLTLAPLACAFALTIGALGLLRQPLSIPSLMLAPVIVGMGIDYGLYLVRSRQRFGNEPHPGMEAFQKAVVLGGVSTLIGAGSLSMSDHQVLQQAGTSTFLGIAFVLLGTFIIVPPFLNRIYKERPAGNVVVKIGGSEHRKAVMQRYKGLEPIPKYNAFFKMLLDPMFNQLAGFIQPGQMLLDVGCGFGIQAAWLLAIYPDLKIVCMEPQPERARIANRILKGDAIVINKDALSLDESVGSVDVALVLDVIHHLSDSDLETFLVNVHERLLPNGKLVVRVTVPGSGNKMRWQRWLETCRISFSGRKAHYRSQTELTKIFEKAGFHVESVEPTDTGREETWFIMR